MTNLADGILQQRDRLMEVKTTIGETWDLPNLFFYRMTWARLIDRANEALAGRLDVAEMTQLFLEMREFES